MKITSAKFVKGITGDDDLLHDGTPHIAFVGRSNVGKSSVINALLNAKELARTGKKPGKTLELNVFAVNAKYYFIDLPGYGYAKGGHDQREAIRDMIIGYLSQNESKPMTVALVLDAKAGVTDFDRDMLHILGDNEHHVVIVLNKKDKLSQKELSDTLYQIQREFPGITIVPYSATTQRKGADVLLSKLFA